MIGHEKIIADLKGLHERGELSHGYILHGPSMVGKRLAAMSFANFLEKGDFGGGKGDGDAGEASGILSDMMLVEPGESASIGIDVVRAARNFLWKKPNASPRRTLIIDDAELLTTEAQNALLKLTEEPPASSLLILVTSDAESLLPTIISRLPKIYFGAVPEKEIVAWLGGEKSKITESKAAEIAKKAMGKPGLARRLRDDEDFKTLLESAGQLLRASAAMRRDLLKKIIEPEDFNFRKFLDAVIMNLAWREAAASDAHKKNAPLWHRTLRLYDRETNFSLNPRLQLEALFA